jgi:acetylornithine deacetylase
LADEDPTFDAGLETLLVREPFEVRADAPVVRAVDDAVRATLGREAEHIGDTPWMDSALLAAAGVETVVIGPAGGGAHAAEEWVEVSSLVALAEILARTALAYCGAA